MTLRTFVVLLTLVSAGTALGYNDGTKAVGQSCSGCHSAGGAPAMTITWHLPASCTSGQPCAMSLDVGGGGTTNINSGCAIYGPAGTTASTIQSGLVSTIKNTTSYVTHSPMPVAFTSTKTYNFSITATAAFSVTAYCVLGDGAQNKNPNLKSTSTSIPVSASNPPPTISAGPTANPSPVTAKTTALSVTASGSSALTYTWASTSGPLAVTFSPNGTTAASNTTATFAAAGTYTLQVTVTDTVNQSTTGTVSVTVNATPTALTVAPTSVTLSVNQTQQFTATVKDQFGGTLSGAPVTWSKSGTGAATLSSTGLFTAGSTADGPYTVTATSGALTANASVSIAAASPPSITSTTATPSSVTGTSTQLAVVATDPNGGSLTYAWTQTSGPAASTIASATAASTGVTFSRAGSYNFQVLVTNTAGVQATGTVPVTVAPTPTAVGVSPPTATVAVGSSQQFTAAVTDQFGQPNTSAVTWSVNGGGTIAGGLFQATSAGSFTVTAAVGGGTPSGTASVTVPVPVVDAGTPDAGAGTPDGGAGTPDAGAGAGTADGGAGVPDAGTLSTSLTTRLALVGLLAEQRLSGTVVLEAAASDPSGISSVSFSVDGTPVGVVSAPAYTISLDTRAFPDGHHDLLVAATTMDGRTAVTSPLSVIFSNSTGQAMTGVGCGAAGPAATLEGVVALLAGLALLRRRSRGR